MAEKPAIIEVYEWQEGRPRPGTARKARHDCIDILEVPSDGLPDVGDVVLISDPEGGFTQHRVVSREFFWGRISKDDPTAPATYYKAWIHVRRLTQKEYEAEPSTT